MNFKDTQDASDRSFPLLTPGERELRRQAVMFHRSNARLEGLEMPTELLVLQDAYIDGLLDDEAYRQGCLAYINALTTGKA